MKFKTKGPIVLILLCSLLYITCTSAVSMSLDHEQTKTSLDNKGTNETVYQLSRNDLGGKDRRNGGGITSKGYEHRKTSINNKGMNETVKLRRNDQLGDKDERNGGRSTSKAYDHETASVKSNKRGFRGGGGGFRGRGGGFRGGGYYHHSHQETLIVPVTSLSAPPAALCFVILFV